MKELVRLAASGRGKLVSGVRHPKFGEGLWHYESDVAEIFIFRHGLTYMDSGSNLEHHVAFKDVGNIKSFLTPIVISEASRSGEVDRVLPLELDTIDGRLRLSIPLVIYSSVLIALQELRMKDQ